MSGNRKQKGPHNWDAPLHYHLCPSCNKIIESRDDYFYRLGDYVKEVECPFCRHYFTIKKSAKPSVGPLFGEGGAVEMEWGER